MQHCWSYTDNVSDIYLGLIQNEEYMKLKTAEIAWWNICNNGGCYSIQIPMYRKRKYTIDLDLKEHLLVINESIFAVTPKVTYRLAVGFGGKTKGQIIVLSFDVTG